LEGKLEGFPKEPIKPLGKRISPGVTDLRDEEKQYTVSTKVCVSRG
jgi:hypothetical protein